MEWKLKIYPKGNGQAKDTHMSVFLELTKAFTSGCEYEYKIELLNHLLSKDTVMREYSSHFDIGECWGYNQFIPLPQLAHGFLTDEGDLIFCVSIRNPSYRTLVRDQDNYISFLEAKLSNGNDKAVDAGKANPKPEQPLRSKETVQLSE
jgi:hypothetical protein